MLRRRENPPRYLGGYRPAKAGTTSAGLRRLLPSIEVGDEMGALRSERGSLAGRDKAAAKQALFILAIEENHPHGQILNLADEKINFRLRGAFRERLVLPILAMPPHFFEGIAQAREESFPALINFLQAAGLSVTQQEGFAFGESKEVATDDLMLAQVGEHGIVGSHG